MKKSKSNREKKNGYAHDRWLKYKKERNAKRKQLWDANLNTWIQIGHND